MEYNLICLIQCIGIVLIAVECIYIFAKWKTRQHSYLFLYCISTLINNVGYLMEMTAHSSDAALLGTKMCYLGKVFISFSLFIFVLNTCKIRVSKKILSVLGIFHMFIFMLVLTCKKHTLYYTSITYVKDGLFPHNVFGHGIFYYIFSLLMVLYLVIGLGVLLQALLKQKGRESKILMTYLLVCSLIEAAGFFLFLSGISQGYDLTSPAYTISAVLLFMMLFRHDLMNGIDVVRTQVVEELEDGIIAVDKWGDIFYYNQSALNLFPILKIDGSPVIEQLEKVIASGKDFEKDSCVYTVEMKQIRKKEDIVATLYQINDITDRYLFENELREQKELAESANASKSRFVSMVSHEIRTPMNAVVGMTDLMLAEADKLNEKQTKYLNNIRTSGSALVMIVNDILDQSKLEAGKMEIVEAPYEIRPLVSDVMILIENRIGAKPIRLETDIDPDIPDFLLGDSLRIRQIIINLMNNAVKFTDEGFIRLSIRKADTEESEDHHLSLRFGIQDSGQGIKDEDIARLGKAFSQVDIQKNHGKEGTGLGLSISKDFIALMGGQLEVSSIYGQGSEFYFTISQGRVCETEDSVVSSGDLSATEEIITKKRVLVIDDTLLNLEVTNDMLLLLEAEPDTAYSGSIALRILEEKTFDLILVDYMMPEMNGVEVTKEIRKRNICTEGGNPVTIIALTGDGSAETKEAFFAAGADSIEEKPISLDSLTRILNQLR